MISLIIFKFKLYREVITPAILMTGMTLLFTYIFGIGFSGDSQQTLYILDEDQSTLSQKIISVLESENQYKMILSSKDDSSKEVEKAIEGGTLLYIHDGFANSILNDESSTKDKVEIYKSGNSVENGMMTSEIQSMFNKIISDVDFVDKTIEYYSQQGISLEKNEVEKLLQNYNQNYETMSLQSNYYQGDNERYSTMKHYFAGFMLFFSLFIVMFGIGGLIDEKEFKVFDRIKVSPLSTFKIVSASIIVNFVVGLIQLSIVVIVGKYIFNLDLGNSTVALLAILGVYVMTGTAIGLFITVFVNTQSQLGSILPTFIVSTSMLGGCMWPLDIIENKVLLAIANLTPQKWAMAGVENIIIHNGKLSDIKESIMILIIMTILFTVGTVIGYRKVEGIN